MRIMTRLSMVLLSLACAAARLSPDGSHTHLCGKATGTPEENQQAVRGNSSEFGRYSVDDGGHSITFQFDHAFFPSWEGTSQRCELTWRRLDPPSLVGVWTLTVADEIRPDGSRVHAYGEHPEGQLILDPSGHYSVFVFRTPRTKFASGVKSRGTADEYEAATREVSAHFGRYTVDATSHILTFDIEHASFPNLDGVEEKRPYELVGDDLTYRIPPRADGTVSISSWHRLVR